MRKKKNETNIIEESLRSKKSKSKNTLKYFRRLMEAKSIRKKNILRKKK